MSDSTNQNARPRFGGHQKPEAIQLVRKKRFTLSGFLDTLVKFSQVGVVAYLFIGEFILPEWARASTFISERIIHINERKMVETAEEETDAKVYQGTALAQVDEAKACRLQLQGIENSTMTQCLGDPKMNNISCRMRVENLRRQTACPDFPDNYIPQNNR